MTSRQRIRALSIVVALAVLAIACGNDAGSAEQDPTTILLLGDSIMNQAGVYLEETLEADDSVGEVEVHNEGRNGTGLLTPDLFDWYAQTPELVDGSDPDLIVILFVGNYTSDPLYVTRGGVAVDGYGPLFWDAWEYEARRLQGQLANQGAEIFWVNPPPMAEDEGASRVTEFRQIHRRIAEDWTGTVLIDGTSVLSTEEGAYAFELPNEEGVLEQVRTLDSVHLTQAGSKRLAEEIARQLLPSVIVSQRTTTSG